MTDVHISQRSPETIMRLARLGSLHQCRLSFMRQLTRRMAREAWTFDDPVFEIDETGLGYAVYTTRTPERCYSLVAFAHDLPADQRSDRVIAEAWDATFTLFDGIPAQEDIKRLARNVPLQEAGRITETELTLARANRSVRLWDHVVSALSVGEQPDPQELAAVGYLMRTTAVYGSGKFGAADRSMIADRPEMHAPFQAEMLTVYLIRTFVRDLVNHMARMKGGDKAVALDNALAQSLGIGNSTGLGMAPFLITRPVLFNNWIAARETAIARVRAVEEAAPQEAVMFRELLGRVERMVESWHSDHPYQRDKIATLVRDLYLITDYVLEDDLSSDYPWNRLIIWAEESLSLEGQELIASLILEPYPALVDALGDKMAQDNLHSLLIDGAMPVNQLRAAIERVFGWALDIDWADPDETARVWYVSEEKLEPRLAERTDEDVAEYELPLAPARDAVLAYNILGGWDDHESIARFLTMHPEYRHIVRRVQVTCNYPYSEIRDNTISAELIPIDMLRAKLSFFGATHFDPRSDRWVRICMYGGAPYPGDLERRNCDQWVYPEVRS